MAEAPEIATKKKSAPETSEVLYVQMMEMRLLSVI